jgi:general secretion pathway protein I
MSRAERQAAGFTLLEVLVALAVVAVALLAAIGTATQSTVSAEVLRTRLFATWEAENRLAELRARRAWPDLGVSEGIAEQAGVRLRWRETVDALPDSAFRRVEIAVRVDGGRGGEVRLAGVLRRP